MDIAWIGTGVMGASMAGHLMDAGHRLTLFSRTRSKAEPLLARGAHWAPSPADAAREADVICTMVGFPQDLEEVVWGPEGLLHTARPGSLFIDFTSSRPEASIRMASACAEKEIDALDAPVSGGDIGARNKTLSIMVGGQPEAFERGKPILDAVGANVVYQGGPGCGQHTKIVNQTINASTMIGVCEGLIYAARAGLDPLTVLRSVGSGAAASWALTNLWPRMIAGDFAPGFYVEHYIKDLGIALDEAEALHLHLHGLSLARRFYQKVAELGGARDGTQALLKAIEYFATKEQVN